MREQLPPSQQKWRRASTHIYRLIYLVFAGCLAWQLLLNVNTGLFTECLDSAWRAKPAPYARYGIGGAMGLMCIRLCLDTTNKTPRMDRLLLVEVVLWAFSALLPLGSVPGNGGATDCVLICLALASVSTVMVAGTTRIQQQRRASTRSGMVPMHHERFACADSPAPTLASATQMDEHQIRGLPKHYVAMTNHAFRTPLTAILSAQELLQNYDARLAENDKTALHNTIRSNVKRITDLLDRILLLVQVETGTLAFSPKPLNLVTLMQDIVLATRLLHPNGPCEIETEFPAERIYGMFDETLLRHFVESLLSNALMYSPEGGVVRLSVGAYDSHVVIKVSDKGIGIPAREIAHVFEPFQRGSNVGNVVGNGLGLAIVRQMVDAHRGTVTIHSALGQGTSVEVQLNSPTFSAPHTCPIAL